MLLAFTTWVFCGYVFSTRPEQSQSDTLSNLVRLPASLPAHLSVERPKQEPIRMDVVNIPCWDKSEPEPHVTDARWVRLTGQVCQNAGEVSVRNLSNGYSGTVFSSKTSMMSDYIPLDKGDNEIMVRFQESPGVISESQFTFKRQ